MIRSNIASKKLRATIQPMLIDAVSVTETSAPDPSSRAVARFLAFLERRLGVHVVRDRRHHEDDPQMAAALALSRLLLDNGIIERFYRNHPLPDEPRMCSWSAICKNRTHHQTGGGSWTSDGDALYAALAEALERYIWFMKDDYFVGRTVATAAEIALKGAYIPPQRFSGYSDEQRAEDPRRVISSDSKFTWIQGHSLVNGRPVYVPAQVVSGIGSEYYTHGPAEPLIRPPITNGLATWTTQAGARNAGANEVIEREAYIVMWLNQLSLPRIALEPLAARDATLARLLASCARYGIKMHAIRLLTDAPTHAVAVVFEDLTGNAPRFTIGLRAHRNLTSAILKAAGETFRARRGHRLWTRENTWDPATPARNVGHRDRLYYWGVPENAKRLEFLIAGPEVETEDAEWEHDTPEQQLDRISAWCRVKNFECIAVSLGRSATNPTPLHIEMVVMPDLQWTYLSETTQAFGGTRWRTIPEHFGYTPRATPFADEPHPFS